MFLVVNPLAVSGVVHAFAPPQRKRKRIFFRTWAGATIGAAAFMPFSLASAATYEVSPVLGDAFAVPSWSSWAFLRGR